MPMKPEDLKNAVERAEERCVVECHYHLDTGPILMVLKPGHVLERCCRCQGTRQVHVEHRRK